MACWFCGTVHEVSIAYIQWTLWEAAVFSLCRRHLLAVVTLHPHQVRLLGVRLPGDRWRHLAQPAGASWYPMWFVPHVVWLLFACSAPTDGEDSMASLIELEDTDSDVLFSD